MKLLLWILWPFAQLIGWAIKRTRDKTGLLPLKYFHWIHFLVPAFATELFVFRKQEKGLEVLLMKRPETDAFFPNLWHFPGTIMRYVDSEEAAFDRLSKELDVDVPALDPRLIGMDYRENLRGHAGHIFYAASIETTREYNGTFFPVDALPDMAPHQPAQIQKAVALYRAL